MTDKEMVLLESIIRKLLVDIMNKRKDTYTDLRLIIKNVSSGVFDDIEKDIDGDDIDIEYELYLLLKKIKLCEKTFNGYMII